MKRYIIPLVLLFIVNSFAFTREREVTIRICHTTDIHGSFFPFDFINNRENKGSYARVSTYIRQQREALGDNLLLLDGGDILQGQPSVYYYNFVDTVSKHLAADVMNYIGYDASAMGNHDIETGHEVYDRWVKDCDFPVLGANILKKDGTPYLPAYRIFTRAGIKIAVVGMITEAIPAWLPGNLWEGLRFADIEETSRKLIPVIQRTEKPDIIIGLFHTGVKSSTVAGFKDNAAMEVAERVPGFDMILAGHDHSPFCEKIANLSGDSVLIVNPGAGGNLIGDVTILAKTRKGKLKAKSIQGRLQDISAIEADDAYMKHFEGAYRRTLDYVNAEIGRFTHSISVHNSFFGPSAFVDLLHSLQLKLTNADVSLVAPLSLHARIDSGKVYMRDMFNLYKYENLLYTMKLTGKEIRNALEYSNGLWCNRMTSEEDHLLLIEPNKNDDKYHFVKPFYSFNSAAGIRYTVDVTKPAGKRINISSMADGLPFDENKTYRVAVNSYQGSGGGGILTEGAGIPREELSGRIIFSTDKDMRFYLTEEIKRAGVMSPKPLNQWRFIPEEWVEKAAKRDYELLFGE